MCAVLLPPSVYAIAVNKYIIYQSYPEVDTVSSTYRIRIESSKYRSRITRTESVIAEE